MSTPPLLILLRGAHVVALLSAFGALLFLRTLGTGQAVRRLVRSSAALALVLGASWLAAVAGSVAGVAGPGGAVAAIPELLAYFAFGRQLTARLVLLAALCLLPVTGRAGRAGLVVAAVAIGLQPLLAHAGAITGPRGAVLVACEIVHLLAAGAWAGGLLPLLLAVRAAPAGEGAGLLRRFSALGVLAVAAITVSGIVQLGLLTRGFTNLLGSVYGEALATKLALFIAAMGLALLNRGVLTPRLLGRRAAPTRRAVAASLAAETVLAVGIVLAAAWLASSAPGG